MVGNATFEAFDYLQKGLFRLTHDNGTITSLGELLTPVAKKVHAFFHEDQGFLGQTYHRIIDEAQENPALFYSRCVVVITCAFLAQRCFSTAQSPVFCRALGVIYRQDNPYFERGKRPILQRISLYTLSLGFAAIATYEAVASLAGRAECIGGFHNCTHSLFSDEL